MNCPSNPHTEIAAFSKAEIDRRGLMPATKAEFIVEGLHIAEELPKKFDERELVAELGEQWQKHLKSVMDPFDLAAWIFARGLGQSHLLSQSLDDFVFNGYLYLGWIQDAVGFNGGWKEGDFPIDDLPLEVLSAAVVAETEEFKLALSYLWTLAHR